MPTNKIPTPNFCSSYKPNSPRTPFLDRGPGAMSSAPVDPRPAAPARPQPQPPPLLKQHSWSPDSDRDEAWLRRQGLHRNRRGAGTIARSVTDDDLDELRGCIDLGFGFEPDSPDAVAARLTRTIPALDLYFAVHRKSSASASESTDDDGSSASGGSPVSIFDPGDSAEVKKARLRRWAQVVACSVRQHHR